MPRRPLLLALLALLPWLSGCSPCHSQHTTVTYHAPYDTWEKACVGTDDDKFCIPYIKHHPARCSTWTSCDESCEDRDKGKLEAHAKHQTLWNPAVVDARCTEEGTVK